MKKPASILLTVLSFLSVLCTMSCRRAIVAEGYQHTIVDTLGDFVVSYDTLYIDPSLLTPNTCLNIRSVVRYHDRYYCYCEEEESLCARIATEEHLFSFTTDGRDFRDLSCLHDGLILVHNDSLLSVTEDYVFYLDTLSWQWDSISMANVWYDESIVFNEDDDYYFAFDTHGKWGYYTSFISKETGLDYVWYMYPKRLFRYDNRYFNLAPTVLQWVDDPSKGVEHPGRFLKLNYEESRANTFAWADSSGFAGVFNPEFFFDWDSSFWPDTTFLNAFVWDNSLCVLANNPEETYISRWQNNSLQKVMSFGRRFDCDNYLTYAPFQRLPRNEALLWFKESYKTWGIVDVVDNHVHVTYLECDVDTTINYLGVDSIESILSFYKDNLFNLTPERVDSFEHQIGAIKQRAREMHSPDYEISYHHSLDSILSLSIDVCYRETNCYPLCVDFNLTRNLYVKGRHSYSVYSDPVDSRFWDILYRQFGDTPDEKGVWNLIWNKSGYQFWSHSNGAMWRLWNEKHK